MFLFLFVEVPVIIAVTVLLCNKSFFRAKKAEDAPEGKKEEIKELPQTEAQKEWDKLTEKYLSAHYPNMVSWRNLYPASNPRSACWTALEITTDEGVERIDVDNYLIG